MTSRPDEARFRREYLAEAEELLEQGDELLAQLLEEGTEGGPATLNALFRAVHSLKGVAGMVGLAGIASAAHALESLLDALRLGLVALDPEVASASATALEELRTLSARVAGGESDPAGSAPLKERLLALAASRSSAPDHAGGSGAGASSPPGPPGFERAHASPLPPDVDRVLSDYERHRVDESLRRGRPLVLVSLDFALDRFDEALRRAMDAASQAGELIGTLPGDGSSDLSRISFRLLVSLPPDASADALAHACGGSLLEAAPGAPPGRAEPRPAGSLDSAPAPAAAPAPGPPAPEGEHHRPGHGPETVRVQLEKVSALLDLAGDLALARWNLARPLERLLAASTDRAARVAAQRAFAELDRAVTVLGRAALAVRLVPVDQMSGRLSRTVAAVAPQLGKEAHFELLGGDTEIDKVLADELTDPFLHLVRNALDHGIEPPAERTAAGKPAAGRIVLKAETRGRDVVFQLSDDGGGIDPERVVALAREHGVLGPGDPAPPDPLELLFRPGFSTARRVSEISGRGFGLDVVRTNLAKLKGTVRVTSTPGKGTLFEVTVPATLVLVESLLVRTGGLHFAIPTSGVNRTLLRGLPSPGHPPGPGESALSLPLALDEPGGGTPLPLHPLAEILGLTSDPSDVLSGAVVVAEAGSRRAGIVVSAIVGVRDVIVRPIADSVPRARVISGAAELPGGALALVLDPGLLLDRVFAAAPEAA